MVFHFHLEDREGNNLITRIVGSSSTFYYQYLPLQLKYIKHVQWDFEYEDAVCADRPLGQRANDSSAANGGELFHSILLQFRRSKRFHWLNGNGLHVSNSWFVIFTRLLFSNHLHFRFGRRDFRAVSVDVLHP